MILLLGITKWEAYCLASCKRWQRWLRPGSRSSFLDEPAERLPHEVKPAFRGYQPLNRGGEEGYPNTLCNQIIRSFVT